MVELDLCDFNSVVKCAQQFLALNIPLDGLVNNAGMMTAVRQPTMVCCLVEVTVDNIRCI